MGRKVDCIERLLKKSHSYEEICEWLILNKFTDKVTSSEYTRNKERAEFIYSLLKQGSIDEKVILLYFEWTLLPIETIKITCVTTIEEKFFTYGI